MGLDGKGKGKARDGDGGEPGKGEPVESGDEEEESRGSIGKKRKVDKVDVWAGKKKAKTKKKIEPDTTSTTKPAERTTQPASNPDEVDLKATSALGIDSHNGTTSMPTIPDLPKTEVKPKSLIDGLNKNQRKKLRKKQKKMAQAGT